MPNCVEDPSHSRQVKESTQRVISQALLRDVQEAGNSLELPFGTIFRFDPYGELYYDLQTEGVGTKVLLAQYCSDYTTIGIDGVAMVVNDVIRSGATPFLLSDCLHISNGDSKVVEEIVSGVREGAKLSDCVLASGETGFVSEVLRPPKFLEVPFDLSVSSFGIATKDQVISGRVSPGDAIVGLQSSGIHSNGLTFARNLLLAHWGGKYDETDEPDLIGGPIVKELLTPTRIYSSALKAVRRQIQIKAAVHITGSAFRKFARLAEFNERKYGSQVGFSFDLTPRGELPPIFQLLLDTAKHYGRPISLEEMYATFNMGYGFALVVDKSQVDNAIDFLGKFFPAEKIGEVKARAGIEIQDRIGDEQVRVTY